MVVRTLAIPVCAPGVSFQEFNRYRRELRASVAANVRGAHRHIVDEIDDCIER